MPFAANYMDDEQKKNQQGSGVNISGGAPTNFATGIPGQEAGASKDKKSSGQYANIQSYLDANKDQADTMGSTIAGNVTQKADDATSKIQGFESKAPEVKAYDPNAAYSNLGKLSDDQKNEYRTQKSTGGYSGPQSVDQVEGYQDTMKAANEASTLVKNAGNESGQQALLKDTYKRPNYSAGENRLDQVLLQNSAGSKSALEGLSSKYAGLSGMFDQANQKVGNAVNNATSQALKNKENIVSAEKSQWDSLVNPIQARAAEANVKNPELITRVQNDAMDETLSDETLAQLGLSEGQGLYDLDLSRYVNPNFTQVGINDVADANERSRYQALADLVGDPTRNQIGAAGKDIKPIAFNKDQFDKDFSGKKAEYEKAFNSYDLSGPLRQADNRMLGTARTPAEITQKLGELKQMAAADPQWGMVMGDDINAIESALNNFNDQFKSNRKVKKG